MQVSAVNESCVKSAIEHFFSTETLEDLHLVLNTYYDVEATSNTKLATDLKVIYDVINQSSPRVIGRYPSMFAKHYGVVSVISLFETKLTSVITYRSSLRDLIIDYANAPKHRKADVVEKISRLLGLMERDQNVQSTAGITRTEPLFLELLKARYDTGYSPYTFDLSAFNRTPLDVAVAGFKNVSKYPFVIDTNVTDETYLEYVALCLESLAKKITLCTKSLGLVREFMVSTKGL